MGPKYVAEEEGVGARSLAHNPLKGRGAGYELRDGTKKS
jgi:hypothetical protein